MADKRDYYEVLGVSKSADKSELKKAGCKIRLYKGIEISRKGEGGPTCLTRPLKRI